VAKKRSMVTQSQARKATMRRPKLTQRRGDGDDELTETVSDESQDSESDESEECDSKEDEESEDVQQPVKNLKRPHAEESCFDMWKKRKRH
jgi:hypothetical protein